MTDIWKQRERERKILALVRQVYGKDAWLDMNTDDEVKEIEIYETSESNFPVISVLDKDAFGLIFVMLREKAKKNSDWEDE